MAQERCVCVGGGGGGGVTVGGVVYAARNLSTQCRGPGDRRIGGIASK